MNFEDLRSIIPFYPIQWSSKNVIQWLQFINLQQYAQIFDQIDGSNIDLLTDEVILKDEFNINSICIRRKISNWIKLYEIYLYENHLCAHPLKTFQLSQQQQTKQISDQNNDKDEQQIQYSQKTSQNLQKQTNNYNNKQEEESNMELQKQYLQLNTLGSYTYKSEDKSSKDLKQQQQQQQQIQSQDQQQNKQFSQAPTFLSFENKQKYDFQQQQQGQQQLNGINQKQFQQQQYGSNKLNQNNDDQEENNEDDDDEMPELESEEEEEEIFQMGKKYLLSKINNKNLVCPQIKMDAENQIRIDQSEKSEIRVNFEKQDLNNKMENLLSLKFNEKEENYTLFNTENNQQQYFVDYREQELELQCNKVVQISIEDNFIEILVSSLASSDTESQQLELQVKFRKIIENKLVQVESINKQTDLFKDSLILNIGSESKKNQKDDSILVIGQDNLKIQPCHLQITLKNKKIILSKIDQKLCSFKLQVNPDKESVSIKENSQILILFREQKSDEYKILSLTPISERTFLKIPQCCICKSFDKPLMGKYEVCDDIICSDCMQVDIQLKRCQFCNKKTKEGWQMTF